MNVTKIMAASGLLSALWMPAARAQQPANSAANPAANPTATPQSPQTPANSAPAASPATSTPSSAAGAGATTVPPVPEGGASNPSGDASEEAPPSNTLSAGLDVYSGVSNLEGQRRFSDGFWTPGASVAYPSVAYLKVERRDGSVAKFALGTGDLVRGSTSTLKQPVEAWFQKPVGKLSVTAGKYYVPFALQEWQYETKYGVQLQRGLGQTDFIGSVNYDRIARRPNLYFRAGHNFSDRANAGLSLAAGKGLSYGSLHNKAVALDASLQSGDFKLFSEFLVMQRRASDRFTFFYSKLVFDRDPKLKPFVGFYKWNDRGEAFGDFRSIAAGTTYAIRPDLLVEGGGAATRGKNIFWIQLHLVVERNLLRSKPPFVPRPLAAPSAP